ncbi:MAG: hypothetical protein ABRQ39_03700 [Candidatus Eremiobacterota bacterium]
MITNPLPIKKIVFYKHGIGFFERSGKLSGQKKVTLSFKKKDMNDILKSLVVINKNPEGKVLGISYDTQEDAEVIIKEKSINLGKEKSLRDLLCALRGYNITLNVKGEKISGTVAGIDYSEERRDFSRNVLSLYINDKKQVLTYPLSEINDFLINDPVAAGDLTFFLEKSIGERKKDEKFVTLLLDGDEHDLSISYIASAPIWRVSYRLIHNSKENRGYIMGWGIINNTMEEDLENVEIVLTTGLPVSFTYDLYSPKTLDRPQIKDEARQMTAVIEHDMKKKDQTAGTMKMPVSKVIADTGELCSIHEQKADLFDSTKKTTTLTKGEKESQFFKYTVSNPVTIKRGQSAMVPILTYSFDCLKEHIYTARKMEKNPYLTLSFKNKSPYVFGRGPVTILEDSSYIGEAIIPFISKEQYVRLPYAVDVEVTVKEEFSEYDTFNSFVFIENSAGNYLFYKEVYHTSETLYSANNSSSEEVNLIIEHTPYGHGYELYETLEPVEKTDNYIRWKIILPPKNFQILKIRERKKIHRNEYYNNLSMEKLSQWFKNHCMDEIIYNRLSDIYVFFEQIREIEKWREKLEQDRKQILEKQTSFRDQLQVLGDRGDEGTLRKRYIKNMENQEDRLEEINNEKENLAKKLFELKKKIDQAVAELAREQKQ